MQSETKIIPPLISILYNDFVDALTPIVLFFFRRGEVILTTGWMDLGDGSTFRLLPMLGGGVFDVIIRLNKEPTTIRFD